MYTTSIFAAKPDPFAVRRIYGLRRVALWLPPLFTVCVIACESTGTFSAQHTSGWLRPIFERVFGHFQDANWEEFHHVLRKTGHFIGYGMVALSFLWSWLFEFARRADLTGIRWRVQSNVAAILSTAAIASLDEWHQTFIPSRTGMASDALLDTTGGVAMCLLASLAAWRRKL